MNKKVIIILLAVFFIGSFLAMRLVTVVDDKDAESIFRERFSNTMQQVFIQGGKEWDKATADSLESFPEEFPDSKYADDVKINSLSLWFYTVLGKDNEKLKNCIEQVRSIIAKYPDGKIEESTKKLYDKIAGMPNPFHYLPYDQIINFMEAYLALELENYEEAIDKLLTVKKHIVFIKGKTDFLALDIYYLIAQSYKSLGQSSKINELIAEVTQKFPDNQRLISLLNKIVNQ